jgi:anti-anti-sigma factor
MQTIVSEHQGRVPVTVFQIEGKIDGGSYKQWQDQVNEAFKAGMRYLLLDLSGVVHINSTGLQTVLAIYSLMNDKASQSQGIGSKSPYLKVLNPSPAACQAIRVMCFDRVMEIHNDFDEAIASF